MCSVKWSKYPYHYAYHRNFKNNNVHWWIFLMHLYIAIVSYQPVSINCIKSLFFFLLFAVVNELVIIHVYHNSIISCNYKLWELDGCTWSGFSFEVDSEATLNWGGGCLGPDHWHHTAGHNLRIRHIMLLHTRRQHKWSKKTKTKKKLSINYLMWGDRV